MEKTNKQTNKKGDGIIFGEGAYNLQGMFRGSDKVTSEQIVKVIKVRKQK